MSPEAAALQARQDLKAPRSFWGKVKRLFVGEKLDRKRLAALGELLQLQLGVRPERPRELVSSAPADEDGSAQPALHLSRRWPMRSRAVGMRNSICHTTLARRTAIRLKSNTPHTRP